jgi:iron complex transport system permease protein
MRRFTPWRLARVALVLTALLLAVCLVALGSGAAKISIVDFFLGGAREGGVSGEEAIRARAILFGLRLPRIVLAAIVGAALASSGATFQAVLRNPLADPYILGVSGGAALGAIATAALGLDRGPGGWAIRPLAAFAGAASTILILFLLARLRGRVSNYPLLLTGVVVNALFSALILFIITVADYSRFQQVFFWLVGTLESPGWATLAALAAALALGLGGLFLLSGRLNLLSLGEEEARALGIDVARVKLGAILLASFVTAAAVSWSGLVGFVGLMVPHGARLLWGPDHRLLLPASALGGAAFLVAADTGARTLLAPVEMPVGIITAVIGAPLFLFLFQREKGTVSFD